MQIVMNDTFPLPKFKAYIETAMIGDAHSTLSSIHLCIIMVHNIWSCYLCKIGDIGYFELSNTYDNLCENEVLKEEKTFITDKGITRALSFTSFLSVECIIIILSRFHDMEIWIENGLVKILKNSHSLSHWLCCPSSCEAYMIPIQEFVRGTNKEKWNGWGISINDIDDPIIEFVVRLISHKFY